MRLSTVGLMATLTLAVLLVPLIADAQQATKVHRIGWLRPDPEPALDIFRQGLRDLGYVEGQNLIIEQSFPAHFGERRTISES